MREAIIGRLDGLHGVLEEFEAELRDYLPHRDLNLAERESLAQSLGHLGAGATVLAHLVIDARDGVS